MGPGAVLVAVVGVAWVQAGVRGVVAGVRGVAAGLWGCGLWVWPRRGFVMLRNSKKMMRMRLWWGGIARSPP